MSAQAPPKHTTERQYTHWLTLWQSSPLYHRWHSTWRWESAWRSWCQRYTMCRFDLQWPLRSDRTPHHSRPARTSTRASASHRAQHQYPEGSFTFSTLWFGSIRYRSQCRTRHPKHFYQLLRRSCSWAGGTGCYQTRASRNHKPHALSKFILDAQLKMCNTFHNRRKGK